MVFDDTILLLVTGLTGKFFPDCNRDPFIVVLLLIIWVT